MALARKVEREARECCLPYIQQYGQPAMHTTKTFPPAASYADYVNQEQELLALLDLFDACVHIREAAIAAHKSLCGNEAHVKLEIHAQICGVSPEEFESLMNTP
jgi:hypothetical protein